MIAKRSCEQCGNVFEPKAPHQRFDFDECRYQHHIEESVAAACQRVEPPPLQAVRDQRTVSKHDRDLGGLIKQAIIDRLKTTGECFPDDLIPLYPAGEVDRCRELATAQFGSLAAPRGGREPLIREKGRRKSSIPARKGAKATVWELSPAGRVHYGIAGLDRGHTLGGSSTVESGDGSAEGQGFAGALNPSPSDAALGGAPGVGHTPGKCDEGSPPASQVAAGSGPSPDPLFPAAPSAYDCWEAA